jgi:hypothetical protein
LLVIFASPITFQNRELWLERRVGSSRLSRLSRLIRRLSRLIRRLSRLERSRLPRLRSRFG